MTSYTRDLITIIGAILLYWSACIVYFWTPRARALRSALTTVVDSREVDVDAHTKELTVTIRMRLMRLALLVLGPPAVLVLMWAALR